jgi:hypothetical protein
LRRIKRTIERIKVSGNTNDMQKMAMKSQIAKHENKAINDRSRTEFRAVSVPTTSALHDMMVSHRRRWTRGKSQFTFRSRNTLEEFNAKNIFFLQRLHTKNKLRNEPTCQNRNDASVENKTKKD